MLRTVVENDEFWEKLVATAKTPRRADELTDGLKHLLSKKPQLGKRIDDCSDVWAFSTRRDACDISPITVFYAFDDYQVVLLDLIER